jgi:hypothetical protein
MDLVTQMAIWPLDAIASQLWTALDGSSTLGQNTRRSTLPPTRAVITHR